MIQIIIIALLISLASADEVCVKVDSTTMICIDDDGTDRLIFTI